MNETANDLPIDVLVIGGGPAGSTAAALLAGKGWRVRQLEKGSHPRFHIGESLLPMNLGVLERLGVLEQVRAIGVYKPGADFPTDDGGSSRFAFSRALGATYDHAFQVRRSEFDQLLFEHAQRCGADSREHSEALSVQRDADGLMQVRIRDSGGEVASEETLCCRYVVDASGRDTLIGRQRSIKRANPRHRSAALFAHFEGVEPLPGENAGNITIYRLPHGWSWMIPLRGGVMSVGAVCTPEYLKTRHGAQDVFLMDTLRTNPDARQRMRDARQVSETYATGNYSYACTEIAGPGWIMAGDAYAFVDPVFSSGVYLATSSAERVAALVDQVLREPEVEAALQRAYRQRVDHGIKVFSWFIERFTTPVMKALFDRPRNVWQVEQAVISMLAGDVYDNKPVLRRLRVFRVIYFLTALRLRCFGSDERRATVAKAG